MTFNFAISGSTMFNSFNIGWIILTKLQRSWNSVSVSKSSFFRAYRLNLLFKICHLFQISRRCLWMLKLICIFLSLYQFAQRNMKDIVYIFWLVCQRLFHLLSHGSVIFDCIYMHVCVARKSSPTQNACYFEAPY